MIMGAASTPKPTAADVLRSERRLVGLKILLTVFSYVDAYIVEKMIGPCRSSSASGMHYKL
jgi:hypothetical protein